MLKFIITELHKTNVLEDVSQEEEKIKLNQEMPLKGRIHKIQILRMKLLNFVNSLHNYIMTRVSSRLFDLELKIDFKLAKKIWSAIHYTICIVFWEFVFGISMKITRMILHSIGFELYIMFIKVYFECQQILHSTGLEFKEEMERSQDLDQIIEVHSRYVHKLHERCMMHKKVSFLREAVMKVLNLVLVFHQLWGESIHHIRYVN